MDAETATSDTSAREKLAENLKQMVSEADNLLAKAERSGTDQLKTAREKFDTQLRHAKDELRRLENKALDQAKHAARVTDHAVQDHPYAAMGLAAGVGVLIGMLISRR